MSSPAADTTCRRIQLVAVNGISVAIMAVNFFVSPIDFIFRALIMIKIPDLPVTRVVATLTLFAKPQFMLVFLLVAGIAIRLGILVFGRLVTFLALGPEVFAQ